jgi:hypothetical protein
MAPILKVVPRGSNAQQQNGLHGDTKSVKRCRLRTELIVLSDDRWILRAGKFSALAKLGLVVPTHCTAYGSRLKLRRLSVCNGFTIVTFRDGVTLRFQVFLQDAGTVLSQSIDDAGTVNSWRKGELRVDVQAYQVFFAELGPRISPKQA